MGANFGTKLKYYINVDETLDIFPCHAVAGLIGSLCTYVALLMAYEARRLTLDLSIAAEASSQTLE